MQNGLSVCKRVQLHSALRPWPHGPCLLSRHVVSQKTVSCLHRCLSSVTVWLIASVTRDSAPHLAALPFHYSRPHSADQGNWRETSTQQWQSPLLYSITLAAAAATATATLTVWPWSMIYPSRLWCFWLDASDSPKRFPLWDVWETRPQFEWL